MPTNSQLSPRDPEVRRARASIAARARLGLPPTKATSRVLIEHRLEKYVADVVAKAPPLRAETVDRIVSLLHDAQGDLEPEDGPMPRRTFRRRSCDVCGLASGPSGISSHQRATGHSGWTGVE